MAQGITKPTYYMSSTADTNGWFIRKWPDGWSEYWLWYYGTSSFTNSYAGRYRGTTTINLPVESIPIIQNVQATPIGDNNVYWNTIITVQVKRPTIDIVGERGTSVENVRVGYALYIMCRYK